MTKKWAYTCTSASVITSTIAVISYALSASIVAITFGAITAGLCVATAALLHQSLSTIHVDEKTSEESHSRRTSDDIDGQANEESATSATADVLDNPHLDETSGLLSSSFFPVYLDQRITAARRTLRPVSLVIFELDGLDIEQSEDRAFYISAVGDVVKRTLRESDCAFRIDQNVFAAVMDDTTEAGAVWAAERVRGVLHTGALAGRVTVSAGVACYPSHALESEDLIAQANKALEGAKARGVDQVEIAAEQ